MGESVGQQEMVVIHVLGGTGPCTPSPCQTPNSAFSQPVSSTWGPSPGHYHRRACAQTHTRSYLSGFQATEEGCSPSK